MKVTDELLELLGLTRVRGITSAVLTMLPTGLPELVVTIDVLSLNIVPVAPDAPASARNPYVDAAYPRGTRGAA